MPVTFVKNDQFPLISPPAPIPTPDSELFVINKIMCDGREIWMSAPQPDRLSFVIPISSYVYADNIPHNLSVPGFLDMFVERISEPPFPIEQIGPMKYANGGKDWRAATLDFGNRQSRIHFRYYKRKDLGISLRLDMNPRKVGTQGFKQLIKLLEPIFSINKMAEAARITRLDVAVDVVGVRVNEVLATYKKQGTRSLYVGRDGALETIYIHRKRPPFKQKEDKWGPLKAIHPKQPAGKVVLKLYDRVKERGAIGQPPPYSDAPITRIELVKTHFAKFRLGDLYKLTDPFGEVRVGYAPSQMTNAKALWHRYWQMRRSITHEEAAQALGLSKTMSTLFTKAMKVPKADLLAHNANWADWHIGTANCGLDLLIKSGQKPAA